MSLDDDELEAAVEKLAGLNEEQLKREVLRIMLRIANSREQHSERLRQMDREMLEGLNINGGFFRQGDADSTG